MNGVKCSAIVNKIMNSCRLRALYENCVAKITVWIWINTKMSIPGWRMTKMHTYKNVWDRNDCANIFKLKDAKANKVCFIFEAVFIKSNRNWQSSITNAICSNMMSNFNFCNGCASISILNYILNVSIEIRFRNRAKKKAFLSSNFHFSRHSPINWN